MVDVPGVVTFNYDSWNAMFPELMPDVNESTARGFFMRAGLVLNNTPRSRVRDLAEREPLLYLLVAHLCKLYTKTNGQLPSGAVGRVSTASEGSVSVSLDIGPTTASQAWYVQTQYGFDFWNATARFRQARYLVSSYNYPFSYPYSYTMPLGVPYAGIF